MRSEARALDERTTTDVQAWTKTLFAAIDAKDCAAFLRFVTDDAAFCFANFPAAIGTEAIRAAVEGFFASVAALRHEVGDVWSVAGHVVCRGMVTYTRHDGVAVTLPFCNVLAMDGERVADYRIYIDPAPLLAPRSEG